jgi:adenine-specific DNA-methyltransferase
MRTEFSWYGKNKAIQESQKPSNGTLRPVKSESKNWDTTGNLYIEGDNLEVLKLLQKSYYNKIKMIYIDPPYNTGKDFIYQNNYSHTNWLNMMYPRLRLARNLLTDDGVIFISIDDHEVANLRKVCEEIFGEENFISQIIWEKTFAIKNDSIYFSSKHEYILVYAKRKKINKSDYGFNLNLLPRNEVPKGYRNPDNDHRGLWSSCSLLGVGESKSCVYEIVSSSGKKSVPKKGNRWIYNNEKMNEMIKDNRIWFGADGNNVPRIKRFLSEVQQGATPNTLWLSNEVGHTQEGKQETNKLFNAPVFDFPKPIKLIKRIIQLSTNDNDLILDFFAGSSTTAHAVMDLNNEDNGNRKFIMVQLPEVVDKKSEAFKAGYKNIAEIGKERIRRAGEKILNNNKDLDIGFKVFKLGVIV